MTCFVLTTHPTRNTVVVAASNLFPKTCVAIETPLVVFRCDPTERQPAAFSPFCHASTWNCYLQYLLLPHNIQDQLLDFYCDIHSPKAEIQRYLFSQVPPSAHLEHEFDSELFIRVSMLIEFNAFANHDGDFALYSLMGKLSHSCRPNCHWWPEAGKMRVQVIDYITAGEELTIDYEASRSQTQPIQFRRPYLLRSKGFTCMCPRCSATFDDTRPFYCIKAPKCSGIHYKSNHHPTNFLLTSCNKCHYEPTEKETISIQDEERLLLVQTTQRKKVDPNPYHQLNINIANVTKELKPPHPHHYLAQDYWSVKLLDAQKHVCEVSQLTLFLKSKVECLQSIVPYACEETARELEDLGDSLGDDDASTGFCAVTPFGSKTFPGNLKLTVMGERRKFQVHGRIPTMKDLKEAQKVYRETLVMFGVLRGDTSPAVGNVSNKLLEVQKKLSWYEDVVLPLQVCCLCGHICDSKRGEAPMKNCGKCRKVSYCCVEHQRAQWRIHKKHCIP